MFIDNYGIKELCNGRFYDIRVTDGKAEINTKKIVSYFEYDDDAISLILRERYCFPSRFVKLVAECILGKYGEYSASAFDILSDEGREIIFLAKLAVDEYDESEDECVQYYNQEGGIAKKLFKKLHRLKV